MTIPTGASQKITPAHSDPSHEQGTRQQPHTPYASPPVPFNPKDELHTLERRNSWSIELHPPAVPKVWQRAEQINLRKDFPNVKFLAFDFDQTIANIEPLHHEAFRSAAIALIRTVRHDFSDKDPCFADFWKLAKRGFGLQEMDTVKVFTKAITEVYPGVSRALLEREAHLLPPEQSRRILSVLTSRDRMEAQDTRLDEVDYQAVISRVRGAFKHKKDGIVEQLLKSPELEIRLVPGAIDLLRRAKAAGLLLGLVTGSPSTVVKPILERLGILELFDELVFNDDSAIKSDAQRKPGPFPYEELTRRMSRRYGQPLTTADGVAFEDSLTGMRSAHRAGMPVVVRPPAMPSLFKKLFAPKGNFSEVPYGMKTWETDTIESRESLVRELGEQPDGSNAKIVLLWRDPRSTHSPSTAVKASRQNLPWDSVTIDDECTSA